MNYKKEYDRWMSNVVTPDLLDELKTMDDKAIEDAFYRDLAFGTTRQGRTACRNRSR